MIIKTILICYLFKGGEQSTKIILIRFKAIESMFVKKKKIKTFRS